MIEEQGDIVGFVDNETFKLDLLSKAVVLFMDLLQERRAALVLSPITGKLDVREKVEGTSKS